ncbi:SMI1/KNR4 family protein [Lysinibacillus sp. NPDC093688]|uniref:SMI1/KNR4 family protein n=1 Tax=Lysinibacillus sp. NPDC093688 TaxID=3390577 RepID=UPI003D0784D9
MSIELVLTSLNKRLEKEKTITIQRENGEILNVTCDWNRPVTDQELKEFSLKINHILPKDFCSFLKLCNGGKLFSDGVDCFELFNLKEILNYLNEYNTNINYKSAYNKNWYMIGYYKGYGDYLFIDSEKVANGDNDYLIYVQVGDIQRLSMNFETWLDRFIVAQGARYWLW